ncbi:MAG: cation:proton antiporter [Promethearchaeia archaeon]
MDVQFINFRHNFRFFLVFSDIVNSYEFKFLSQWGMMGFLFLIGLNLDLKKIKKVGGYIVFATLSLALTEGLTVAFILYYFFPNDVSNSFIIALIVGLGFGTIGEVVLLAILMEFNVEKTEFGQITLGMGVFDDIVEILLISMVTVLLPAINPTDGKSGCPVVNPLFLILNLVAMIIITIINIKLGKRIQSIIQKNKNIPPFIVPFLILSTLYLYVVLSSLNSETMGLIGAIFAGIAVKAMIPEKMMKKQGNALRYAFMFLISPIFFFSMGYKISLITLLVAPLVIVMFVLISVIIRVSGSTLIFRKRLGSTKEAALLGVGVCAKFSTSIIIITILYTSGCISQYIFSVLMGAFLLMKPLIVIVFARGVSSVIAKKKNEIEEINH